MFPAPLTEEAVFSPLYILASFIKDKVTICAWVYLWAFYPVPLMYISVFVPVPYCLDYCSFVVQSEVREPDSSSGLGSWLPTGRYPLSSPSVSAQSILLLSTAPAKNHVLYPSYQSMEAVEPRASPSFRIGMILILEQSKLKSGEHVWAWVAQFSV